MIPVKPSDTTRRRYLNNIIATYNQATPDQRKRGHSWYTSANQLATMISGGRTRAGAGVLAALSANKAWDINQQLAADAFATGKPSKHVRDALSKASRIMSGEDPIEVLPMAMKTGNFFRCIADPNDTEAVVIDRHAHDVAVGRPWGNRDRGLSSASRYAVLSLAYRNAAAKLGILPSELQATVWVVWTERNAGTNHRPTTERYAHV